MKKVILNADDFGLSRIFNQEILFLLEERVIRSTTVMADRIDTELQKSDIQQLLKIKSISVGLHVEFTSDVDFEGEVSRQWQRFEDIFGRVPSHIDMHKHDHMEKGYPVIMNFAADLNVPFRNNGISFERGKSTSIWAMSASKSSLDVII